MPYRTRILGFERVRTAVLVMGALFAVGVVAMRGALLVVEYHQAIQRGEAGTRDLARLVEEYARRSFETSSLVTSQVADYVAEAGGVAELEGSDRAHRFLAEIASRASSDHLLLIDADGFPAALDSLYPAPRVSLADRPWLRAHRDGATTHIGEAIYSRITHEILFTFSRRLERPDGSFDGAVQVSMKPTFFQQVSASSDVARGVILGLWRPDGAVLAHTGLKPDGLRVSMGALFAEAQPSSATVTIRRKSPIDGNERLISIRRVEGWDAVATASVPITSVLAPFYASLGWSAVVVTLVLGGLGAMTWIGLRVAGSQEATADALIAANDSLRRSHEDLQRLVEERTEELRSANAGLAETSTRFRGIFDAMFQFVGLLAPDGTLLEANRTALGFAGIERDDVVGKPFWEAHWWQMGEATIERLKDSIRRAAAGEFVRYEVQVRGRGEVRALIDFSLRPVRDESGAVVLLVPEGRDLTELKAAQARLEATQRLEGLGQLTGGVAHDFNNLLTPILGNLELVQRRLPDDPRLHRLVDHAIQAARRGATLTGRLLAFARRQDLALTAVDVASLVHEMDDLLVRSLPPGCRLVTEIPPDLPPIRADAHQLELALLNLVINARDALPDGGTIRIVAAAIAEDDPAKPADLIAGAFVRIAVIDDGAGMDEATLARCVEPFFTTKGPDRGSGLGLAMVDGLVRQCGGAMRIDSRLRRGTTVEMFVPVMQGEVGVAREGADAIPATGARWRILVVDDDALVLLGTIAVLEDLGHEAVAADSAAAALEILERGEAFDLVLTDFAMPGTTGLALARDLRQRRPELPVVLVTGYAELAESERGSLVRLAKPFTREELAATLERVLTTRRDAA